jgi:hypothetical protein
LVVPIQKLGVLTSHWSFFWSEMCNFLLFLVISRNSSILDNDQFREIATT